LKSAPPEPPVLDGVVVAGAGVAVPPVFDGAGVGVGVALGVTPPEDEGVAAEGVAAEVVLVVVVMVAADELALLGAGVAPLGGAESTGVVLGTS
jgi:hypothetical protein